MYVLDELIFIEEGWNPFDLGIAMEPSI